MFPKRNDEERVLVDPDQSTIETLPGHGSRCVGSVIGINEWADPFWNSSGPR